MSGDEGFSVSTGVFRVDRSGRRLGSCIGRGLRGFGAAGALLGGDGFDYCGAFAGGGEWKLALGCGGAE